MNNDTGPRMELRALLAVVLSMVALTVYQYFFVPPPETPVEPEAAVTEAAPAAPEQRPAVNSPESEAAPTEEEEAAAAPAVAPEEAVGEQSARTLTVLAPHYRAVLTNVGGRIESFVLSDFEDNFGKPLDLVHPRARERDELMLQLETPDDPDAAAAPNNGLFEIRVDGVAVEDARREVADTPLPVELVWADGAGWEVHKRIVFPPQGHQIPLSMQVAAPGGVQVFTSLGPGLNPVNTDSRNVYLRQGAVALGPDGLEKWNAGKVEGPMTLSGPFRWAAVQSHYFLGAFLLEREAVLRVQSVTVPAVVPEAGAPAPAPGTEEEEEPATVDLVQLQVDVPPTGMDTLLFLGPKRYSDMLQEGHELAQVVDFGMFGIIARPLLYVLIWIHSMVGNYGVSIILLTVLLRLVFLPLNHKAMVSMRKTQSLQPQMAAIRARYKGVKDMEKKQKMNEEIMELYRREGVSPFGGCLPMVAQFPILFAFYALLSVSIELRSAPFILWIHDLSKYDPYLVLPLIMGALMFLQQRMSPTAGGNPTQTRMMGLMPVIFTIMFLYVPSGLVLYWTTNNVLGIGQQVYVNRTLETPAPSKQGRGKGKGKKAQRGKR